MLWLLQVLVDAPSSVSVVPGGCGSRFLSCGHLGVLPVHARVGKGYGVLFRLLLSDIVECRPAITVATSTSVITTSLSTLPSLQYIQQHFQHRAPISQILPSPLPHPMFPSPIFRNCSLHACHIYFPTTLPPHQPITPPLLPHYSHNHISLIPSQHATVKGN